MPDTDQVFYLRHLVTTSIQLSAWKEERELDLHAHFYVRCENDLDAGAVAADYESRNGLTFVEYVSLPVPLSKSQIREYEPEHEDAFDVALSGGFACVVSMVLA